MFIGGLGVQDSFHRQRSPSLEREAQIPPLRMNQTRNIPIFSGHFTVFLHQPKAEQISLPLEGGGPRSGGRSLLFPPPEQFDKSKFEKLYIVSTRFKPIAITAFISKAASPFTAPARQTHLRRYGYR